MTSNRDEQNGRQMDDTEPIQKRRSITDDIANIKLVECKLDKYKILI